MAISWRASLPGFHWEEGMRKLIPLATLIAIVGALVAGVAASTAATKATKEKCSATNYNPTPNKLSGVYFAFYRCNAPFGNTVESGTYKATVNTMTGAGTAKGTFTRWFLTGTDHGHYSETFQFTSATDATYKIAITVTGGTGPFDRVKGKGTGSCSTTNGGATLSCKIVVALTGL
jgi:hypothetical protein